MFLRHCRRFGRIWSDCSLDYATNFDIWSRPTPRGNLPCLGLVLTSPSKGQTATPSTNISDTATADTVQNEELSKKGTSNEGAVTEKKTANQIKKNAKKQAKLETFARKQEQKQ